MFIQRARSSVVSDLRFETRFLVRVWSLALCTVELAAVVNRRESGELKKERGE